MKVVGEVAEREECVIEWTVRDFFSLPVRVGDSYLSPCFSFDGARWGLAMYPNGRKKHESEGYIGVRLYRQSPGTEPIELNFSLGLKTSKNEIAEKSHETYTFEKQFENRGRIRFLKRSTLLERKAELAPSGHLTFVCRLKHPPSTDAASDNSASAGMDKFLEHMKHPFLNHQNCDVVLRVQGQDFQAHKVILTAHSHVFASLFQNDTKEKATTIVDIEDCSPSTFSDFLYFLYCQETDRLSKENVLSLVAAADKYGVSGLRTKCLEFIKEKISAHTFGDTLASCHSETESIQLAAA